MEYYTMKKCKLYLTQHHRYAPNIILSKEIRHSHLPKKRSQTRRVDFVWLDLYEFQKQAKEICADRIQKSVYIWRANEGEGT